MLESDWVKCINKYVYSRLKIRVLWREFLPFEFVLNDFSLPKLFSFKTFSSIQNELVRARYITQFVIKMLNVFVCTLIVFLYAFFFLLNRLVVIIGIPHPLATQNKILKR